jgi:hypothetical protein
LSVTETNRLMWFEEIIANLMRVTRNTQVHCVWAECRGNFCNDVNLYSWRCWGPNLDWVARYSGRCFQWCSSVILGKCISINLRPLAFKLFRIYSFIHRPTIRRYIADSVVTSQSTAVFQIKMCLIMHCPLKTCKGPKVKLGTS